jgi:hypothetical protein
MHAQALANAQVHHAQARSKALTGKSMHTPLGMAGYVTKDAGKAHYRCRTSASLTPEMLAEAKREYLRFGNITKKGMAALNQRNIFEKAETFRQTNICSSGALEGNGISVFDSAVKQTITHRGYLLTAVGDTPVATCFMNAWGHTALWGCRRCFFQGCAGRKLGGSGGVFFLGYAKKALQKHGLFGPFGLDPQSNLTYSVQQPAESPAATLSASDAQDTTHELLRALGRHAEAQVMAGASTISTPCVKGRSIFAQRPYFDTRFGVLIPISHCFLYGTVKKFCKLVLPKKLKNKPWEVSSANREAVSARAAHLVLPADSARAYRDIVKYGSSYTMEDFGSFIGTAGLFVLRGMLPGGDGGPLWRSFTFYVFQ